MPPDPAIIDIDRMPRGGPDASWAHRRRQTDRLVLPLTVVHPFAHEAVIGSPRAYSPSAMRALARNADPTLQLRLHKQPWGRQIVVANRPG
jgi:hypothetical protein